MFGKLLNTLIENAADRWLKSDAAKRYLSSLVLRWGAVGLALVLARVGTQYGVTPEQQASITAHWGSILELAAPAVGLALIELASKAKANLNAKTLEVAVASPAKSLTPATAKEEAKVMLAQTA